MQNKIRKNLMIIFLLFYLTSCCLSSFNHPKNMNTDYYTNNISITEYENKVIQSLPKLMVMVDDNFTPLSFYDSSNYRYSGASVELFTNIADSLGIEYVLNYDRKITWEDKLELIRNKQIDILLPVSVTKSRQQFGHFSSPYYSMCYSVIARVDNINTINNIYELTDKKIGLVNGSSINDFIEKIVPKHLITYYDSDKKMYKGLVKKDIVYGFQNENVFIEDFYKYELFDLTKIYRIVESPKEYCFFFKKDNDMKVLSNVISRSITNVNLTQLLDKYKYGELLLLSKYMIQKRNRNIIIIMFAITILVLAIMMVFYIKNKNQSKKIKLEAAINEMAYLQSQIRPHFLFNTISAIMSFSYTDPERARDLLNSLSKYLRIIFNTNNKSEFITIEEEMELIQSYVNIEKARYGERLITIFEINDECLSFKIMPLIIQPLIENAIRHNITKKDGAITLKLLISKDQENIKVIIEDNGIGISEEKISSILNEKDGDFGIGIANIKKRLKSIGGKRMIIQSNENRGTKITLLLPINKELAYVKSNIS